jgi:heterodisulfide reductase subunit A
MSEQPRVGVLLCSCRREMQERLDYDAISSAIAANGSVVHVERHPVWCLKPGLSRLKAVLREKSIDRLVVAGCSYRTHRRIFADALQDAGVNPYVLEIVNLRDHCAAVHAEGATARARDQIMMGIARAVELRPLKDVTVLAVSRALVIGGGVSGLVAADTLAAAGCATVLVEGEASLGGHLRDRPWRMRESGQDLFGTLISRIQANPSIETHTSARVESVGGEPGRFEVIVRSTSGEKRYTVGVILLATGSAMAPPEGAYGHNGRDVRTQEEFEQVLYGEEWAKRPLSIVMIQCVGSRNERRPYCSRVCCHGAVRNATAAKKKWPETDVAILFRDLEMGCLTERDVKHALDAGVVFYRFDASHPPRVEGGRVSMLDTLTGREVALLYDQLVLSVGETARRETAAVARLLNIQTDVYGFVPEPTVRLRPNESTGRGVYVTGAAHWPVTPEEAMYQAFEMASRAATDLLKGMLTTRPIVASVDSAKCIGCHLCESMCAWGAIRVASTSQGFKASVQEILCKGCGTCVASCPALAIRAAYYADEQIMPAIKAAVGT